MNMFIRKFLAFFALSLGLSQFSSANAEMCLSDGGSLYVWDGADPSPVHQLGKGAYKQEISWPNPVTTVCFNCSDDPRGEDCTDLDKHMVLQVSFSVGRRFSGEEAGLTAAEDVLVGEIDFEPMDAEFFRPRTPTPFSFAFNIIL